MKKTLYKITSGLLMLSLALSSCDKGFEELNTDPNTVTTVLPSQLLGPALVNTVTLGMMRNRNFNNELMQVTVTPTDAEGAVFRYDYRSTFSDYLYNGYYTQLKNLKDVYKISADSGANFNRSYQAISLICQSWVYSILTDTYGDIPYFQSNLGRDSLNFEPRFDRQKDIYLDIFSKLELANSLLVSNTSIPAASDPVYGGNVSLWRKFGNSLYLRLLLRVSGKAEVSAQVIQKIKEIAETKSSEYPKISSNAESAILKWTGVSPFISPYNSIREQDFRAPGLGSFFIDNLVNWNDPRIDAPTYGTIVNGVAYNRWGIATSGGKYFGLPSGYAPNSNPVRGSYFFSNTSPVSLQTDPLTGMIMNYAEVQFILAEAAVKGWISASPEALYNSGAENSITLWLPNWKTTINPTTGLPNDIVTQLRAGDIQWDPAATFEAKMEKIHLQKYYALFLVDLQQWFEYRRTGYPTLPKGPGLRNGGVMPARMTYPVYVQSTNPTNYKLAIEAQGPDVISTQVWWQKP
jgi:hypothetical protein